MEYALRINDMNPQPHKSAGFQPPPQLELLLRAALLSGDEALSAWRAWQSQANIRQPGFHARRLLPLLHQNLLAHGVKHPWLEQMQAERQRAWYANQALLRRAASIIKTLHNAGIPTLVLKGAALLPLWYRDYGLRPMDDIDILVPTAQAQAAVETLQRSGWQPLLRTAKQFRPPLFSVSHGEAFASDANEEHLDLHWHVLYMCCAANADEDFWRAAMPLKFKNVSTLSLNPADMLLHLCLHGARGRPHRAVRWIADAFVLLREAGNALDWARLSSQAKARQVVLPVLKALEYLAQTFHAPIPPEVLSELSNAPLTARDHLEYRLFFHLPDETAYGRWGRLYRQWIMYRRRLRQAERGEWGDFQPLEFMRYLSVTHYSDGLPTLTRKALRRAMRR